MTCLLGGGVTVIQKRKVLPRFCDLQRPPHPTRVRLCARSLGSSQTARQTRRQTDGSTDETPPHSFRQPGDVSASRACDVRGCAERLAASRSGPGRRADDRHGSGECPAGSARSAADLRFRLTAAVHRRGGGGELTCFSRPHRPPSAANTLGPLR